MMTVICKSPDDVYCREYDTDMTDIRAVAAEYGRGRDGESVELYDNGGQLVGRAIWPMGARCYMYAYGGNLDPNPAWCNYIY